MTPMSAAKTDQKEVSAHTHTQKKTKKNENKVAEDNVNTFILRRDCVCVCYFSPSTFYILSIASWLLSLTQNINNKFKHLVWQLLYVVRNFLRIFKSDQDKQSCFIMATVSKMIEFFFLHFFRHRELRAHITHVHTDHHSIISPSDCFFFLSCCEQNKIVIDLKHSGHNDCTVLMCLNDFRN